MKLITEKFEAACQELNALVPIRQKSSWHNAHGYIETTRSPINMGVDKAKQFYELIKKYGFLPIESIPSGFGLTYRLSPRTSPDFFDQD